MISILKTTKEHNAVNNASGVKFLVLCLLSDDTLYCTKFYEYIFLSLKVMEWTWF